MFHFYPIIRPLLFKLDPEKAHNLALRALQYHVIPKNAPMVDSMLRSNVFGLDFDNPVGMAPGFDKNAQSVGGLFSQGFGFVEVGTVTPKPQDGNPKPRLFRLEEDQAVINRMGFNNAGVDIFLKNLQQHTRLGPVGINIGKNKTTKDAVDDYVVMLEKVYHYADYIVMNISSPNTPGLRDLQQKDSLALLMAAMTSKAREIQDKGEAKVPLLLKIDADSDADAMSSMCDVVLEYQLDGMIVSNTTISRPEELQSHQKSEGGGLSGRPLMDRSTKALATVYQATGGKIPLIGVGGIASAEDAYAKIRAGASLVQLYSALIYQGFALVAKINKELPRLIRNDGFATIKEAIGADYKESS